MHPQVVTVSLILLLTGAALSYQEVRAVVGHPATLPCTYSVARGVTSMCWGRGLCPNSQCANTLIWTNGRRITYQKQNRYQLKGQILQGNVSLTIDNLAESDAGLYCCRVELPGWFNDLKYTVSLQVAPDIHTSPPTRPTAPPTRPTARPTRLTTRPARPTYPPTSTSVSTSLPPRRTQTIPTPVATTPSPTWTREIQSTTLQETGTLSTSSPLSSCVPTDGNDTVTPYSDGHWTNQTVLPVPKPQAFDTQGFYIGISIAALVLLLILSAVTVKQYMHMKKKKGSLSLVTYNVSKIGTLQKAAEVGCRAEDNIYVIEDNLYVIN